MMKKLLIMASVIIIVVLAVYIPRVIWHNANSVEKLLFVTAVSSGLFCLFAIIMFVPVLLGMLGFGVATSMGNEKADGKKRLIFQVPKNHRWILRNVWSSDPINLTGYEEKTEGWRFYIPTIWHSDEGLVSLIPKQIDLPPFLINCCDGNDVKVDVRATYFVRSEDQAPIRYVISTTGENVEALITQRIKVAINQAMDVTSENAIKWGTEQKKEYGSKATEIINDLLKNDNGGKDYGLGSTISIENIEPTPEVKAAADRNTAEIYDKKAMQKESQAVKNMIKQTGANPNIVMLAQIVSDFFRGKERKGEKS